MKDLFSAAIPKKAAVINDLTGFGRCSLAVVLPIINAMKVQACPVPTSVFSNHMGFHSYYYQDLTDSYWADEYTFCVENVAEIDAGMDQLLYDSGAGCVVCRRAMVSRRFGICIHRLVYR